MAIWDDVISERDRKVMEASGHGRSMELGSRPVLFIVDAQENFLGLKTDILTSIQTYATSVGNDGWAAVPKIQRLLETARANHIPVMYSLSGTKPNERAFDAFGKKRTSEVPTMGIVAELAPRPEEVVIEKRFASAFHGTPLVSFLNAMKADTLIVCGFTTGGCVRATTVDAVSYNYKVAVVEDGCADRITVSHKVALLDLGMKYADLVTSDQADAYLKSVARSANASA